VLAGAARRVDLELGRALSGRARRPAVAPRPGASRSTRRRTHPDRFDALYTSPLQRARDTAAACRPALGLELVALHDLREVGLGAWEGLTLETVLAQDGERYRRWLEAPVDHPPPGGEPMAGLATRVQTALDGLCRRHPEGRVLVISHGGAISSALCGWLGWPLNAIWSLRLDNASITRVVLPTGQLLALNETGHLADVARETVAP
jgi:broad specificity phosphatase PhoE